MNPRYLRRKLRRLGLPVSPELEAAAKRKGGEESRERREKLRADRLGAGSSAGPTRG